MQSVEDTKKHVQAHNNRLSDEYLSTLDNEQLLRRTHPIYREDYAKMMFAEGCISEEQAKQFKRREL